jgi:MOSC domain-containing protein YiiM
MKVLSVNVGQPRENPWKTMKLTGIDKRPVEGPVKVTAPRAKGRVIEPGEIQAGDEIEIMHRPDHDVTVALVFRALLVEPELLPRLLVADALPAELKEMARWRTA